MPRDATTRWRHAASFLRPACRAITSSGRMPAYVVRQLSRWTRASAPASSGEATRTRKPAATESLDKLLDGGHEVGRVHAEELVHVARGRGFAEAIDADRRALEADVFAPVVADPGLDGDARHAFRKHRRLPCRVLAIEEARARHGDDSHGHARFSE